MSGIRIASLVRNTRRQIHLARLLLHNAGHVSKCNFVCLELGSSSASISWARERADPTKLCFFASVARGSQTLSLRNMAITTRVHSPVPASVSLIQSCRGPESRARFPTVARLCCLWLAAVPTLCHMDSRLKQRRDAQQDHVEKGFHASQPRMSVCLDCGDREPWLTNTWKWPLSQLGNLYDFAVVYLGRQDKAWVTATATSSSRARLLRSAARSAPLFNGLAAWWRDVARLPGAAGAGAARDIRHSCTEPYLRRDCSR